ncbi:PucR family transcriptional regulator [Nocardia brasiliensis]|uniref:PucR family transcriptional regulator n=1 Tax=Nocardia brasiliensis TaxID=37326 RepID=UPI002454A6A1|nr:helix-turn-helix domain-containing protein [Nocardia brasiliensis]
MSAILSPPTDRAPLVTRLLTRWPQISERMLAAGLGTTAPTADLPEGHFTAEVLPAIYACGRAVLQAIGEQREFTRAEVAAFVAPVAQRHAQDRIPLSLLIEAMHGSAQSVLHEAAALAGAAELDELVVVGSRLLELLMHINITVVETYAEVEQSIYHTEREARRALFAALLGGLPAEELAARADTALAERYTVLAIHIRHEDHPSAVAGLISRRRIRILQRTLDALAGTTALATFDGCTGIALLPTGTEHDPDEQPYEQLATELAAHFGVAVFVTEYRCVARESIPQVAREATELAELARLLGRPAGCYRLDDLLLEYQLTRPGPARDRLAERITPILDSPHLIEALDAHLRHGADRKTAAAGIHIHPNTFSYRLRRIADLTGIDPGEPDGSRLLAAAALIHRLFPAADANAATPPGQHLV